MNEHAEIIIEALRDYRNWFTDQGGTEEERLQDLEMLRKINKAIEFVESL